MTPQRQTYEQHKSRLAEIQQRAEALTSKIAEAEAAIAEGEAPQQQAIELKAKRRGLLASLFLGRESESTVQGLDAAIADAEQRSAALALRVEAARAAIEELSAARDAVMHEFADVAKDSLRLQWEALQAEIASARPEYEAAVKVLADAYAKVTGLCRAADSLLYGNAGAELPQVFAGQSMPSGFRLTRPTVKAFDDFQIDYDLMANIEAVKMQTLADIG